MDFDSIISLLVLIAFFILPGILKQFKAAKNKGIAPNQPQKKSSLFDQLGKKIQNFIQELEQQAKKQRESANGENLPSQKTPWDAFEEDDTSNINFETPYEEDIELKYQEHEIVKNTTSTPKSLFDQAETQSYKKDIKTVKIKTPSPEATPTPSIQQQTKANYLFKPDPLQNAVIWSEILGKPVALKN